MGRAWGGIAIYHEHPDWFAPLFRTLERRGIPFAPVRPGDEVLDPALEAWPYDLVFNRMSPSAYLRGGGQAIRFTLEYLRYLESLGVRVVNGLEAFQYEVSKVRQLSLLQRLGVRYPRTRVVHEPDGLARAATGLRFPLVVKPNVGGSGAGIARFDELGQLEDAVARGGIASPLDGTLLLQEYHRPADGRINRVEVLDGRFLYAIRVEASGEDFNLCPADLCRVDASEDPAGGACPSTLPAEGFDPPADVVRTVVRITRESGMDLGGVEYLDSAADGRRYVYDVNALSNFVAEAPLVIGFDPFERLVDFLEVELDRARSAPSRLAAAAT